RKYFWESALGTTGDTRVSQQNLCNLPSRRISQNIGIEIVSASVAKLGVGCRLSSESNILPRVLPTIGFEAVSVPGQRPTYRRVWYT
ncbi:MAG: hypothetical protein ACXW6T_15155, partial [Candidatus Binatia bacterium]